MAGNGTLVAPGAIAAAELIEQAEALQEEEDA